MTRTETINGINCLQRLVQTLPPNVTDQLSYRQFIKDGKFDATLNNIFGFDKLPPNSKRRKVSTLFSVHFHPTFPIIGFNYTPVAHNELHTMTETWTNALRMCRGIVFELGSGDLLALPFEKFFNYGDHPETSDLKPGRYIASKKHDGHLGIIFRYRGQLLITTRGDFMSPTSKIATEMLEKRRWLINQRLPHDCTMLVEIIHPKTHVIQDYGQEEKFILIGCRRNPLVNHVQTSIPNVTIDFSREELEALGQAAKLEVVYMTSGENANDLLKEVARRDITDSEGWVATLASGVRVKFKYVSHVGVMVRRNLSYTYLMRRSLEGNLENRLATLEEEIYPEALRMLGQIALIMFSDGDAKSKWRRLYELVPKEKQTTNYKGVCRKFAQAFTREKTGKTTDDDADASYTSLRKMGNW